jgi:hypothetical protein
MLDQGRLSDFNQVLDSPIQEPHEIVYNSALHRSCKLIPFNLPTFYHGTTSLNLLSRPYREQTLLEYIDTLLTSHNVISTHIHSNHNTLWTRSFESNRIGLRVLLPLKSLKSTCKLKA